MPKTEDKTKIPFYASKLAQSFIDFELNEWQKNSIHVDPDNIDYRLKRGCSIDDIGLLDAVSFLLSHNLDKARKAANLIKDPITKETAERDILCYEERCIR